jgi:zinc protease
MRAARAPLALACLAACGVAFAAHAAGLPARVHAIGGVTEYRFANGLRLITVPDGSVDTVTVQLTYRVGSRHEGYGEKGMAHLLEHMLFRGTALHPDPKAELMARGARWNGVTSEDATTYYETLPAGEGNLDWALGMEADRMLHARIARADLASEMPVVRNEYETGENDPGNVLYHRMLRLAFAWHNYGHPAIGVRSDIEQAPIERLRAFYRTWYRPDDALLIVGGRFEERRALELAARHFGALPRPGTGIPQARTVEPTQDGERSVTLRRAGDVRLVAAMYRVPAGSDADFAPLEVLARLLGETPNGRLHRLLVDKGLASAVWGSARALRDPGYARFVVALASGASIEAARAALLQARAGVAQSAVGSAEVARARTGLLNELDNTQRDSRALIAALGDAEALGDWRLFYLGRDRLRAVSAADVQRVAQKYFVRANRVLGEFLPSAHPERAEIPALGDYERALEGYRPVQRVAPGEAFDPSPENIEARLIRRRLANGIRVALLPKKTRGARVVAALALVWGDETSTRGRQTACSLAGAMLMRGTRRHTRAQLADAFERMNATVRVNGDGAALELQRAQLVPALRLIAEVLRQPAFPPAEFAQLKRSALAAAASRGHRPATLASLALARYLEPYPKEHWLYTPSSDERIAALKAATLEQAKRCYAELYGATGAQFVAVGDFDPDALLREIEALFANWQSPAPYARIPSRHFEVAPAAVALRTPDRANAVLDAGLDLALRDDDPDYPALVLGNYLLGGSISARLPERVREQLGLSYSIYSTFEASALDRVARFRVSASFSPPNRERVERAIREELDRGLAQGFGEAELAAAKHGLLEAWRLARGRDRALATRLAYYLRIGRGFAWDAALERRIAALTPEEVRDALRRRLDPDRLSVVSAGDFR